MVELNITLWSIFALLGVCQGIFLSILLFTTKNGNKKANLILGIFILLFSLHLAEFAGYWTPFFKNYPHFSFVTNSFPFLFGAFLYLYIKQLTIKNYSIKKIELLHFLPFVVQLSLMIPYYLQNYKYKYFVLMQAIYTDNPILPIKFFITRFTQDILMLAYTVLVVKLLRDFKNKVKAYGQKKMASKITLIKNIILGFGIFVLVNMLNLIAISIFKYQYINIVDSSLIICSSILIFVLGYLAMKKPGVIAEYEINDGNAKYEKSGLSEQMAESYLKKIIDSMETEKFFTNNDINLSTLAKELNIPQHHLSQVLNEKLEVNFFDFINKYRVEEAKRLLNCPEHSKQTILAIALESGFNNKVSFNSAFKKYTDQTPSQYRSSSKNTRLNN